MEPEKYSNDKVDILVPKYIESTIAISYKALGRFSITSEKGEIKFVHGSQELYRTQKTQLSDDNQELTDYVIEILWYFILDGEKVVLNERDALLMEVRWSGISDVVYSCVDEADIVYLNRRKL